MRSGSIRSGRLPCLVRIIDKPLRIGPAVQTDFRFRSRRAAFEKNAGFTIVASTNFWMEKESPRLSKIGRRQ